MLNLHLVEDQPRWRVWLVAWCARILGVCIHVEGIPFGKNRSRTNKAQQRLGAQASGQSTTG